jgi:hypothetical protein
LENVPFHAKTEKQKKLQNALTDLGKKMKEIHPKLREAKDSQEYDYEGDMAKSDLRSIMHHAKELHDMIDDNTNLAEWCQSKITLSEDYLSTVANYMRSEMNEEVKKNEYHIAGKHKFPTKDEHAVTVKHTESGREHVHSGKGKYLSKLIKTRYNINHYFEEVEQLQEYESKGGSYKHKGKYGTEYTGKTKETRDQKDAMDLTSLNKGLTSRLEKGMGVKFGRKTYHQVQNKNHLMNVHKNLPEEVELDEKKKLPGLWANIHAKRKRGEAPAKPGDKDYPKDLESVREGVQDDPKADQMTTDDTKFPKKSRKAAIVKSAAKKMPAEDQFQAKPVLDSQVAQQTNK